jgi:hypothetical protein
MTMAANDDGGKRWQRYRLISTDANYGGCIKQLQHNAMARIDGCKRQWRWHQLLQYNVVARWMWTTTTMASTPPVQRHGSMDANDDDDGNDSSSTTLWLVSINANDNGIDSSSTTLWLDGCEQYDAVARINECDDDGIDSSSTTPWLSIDANDDDNGSYSCWWMLATALAVTRINWWMRMTAAMATPDANDNGSGNSNMTVATWLVIVE